jgi:CubicO group peptidase (beta-lactamase class C family)
MRISSASFPLVLLCLTGVSLAQSTEADLDTVAQRVITEQQVVGASVLVARGDRILLHKGYGFADLGLEAPSKPDTVYHVVGPMLPFTGIAIMQ